MRACYKYLLVLFIATSTGSVLPGYALPNKIYSGTKTLSLFAQSPEAIDVRNFPVQNIASRTQILPLIGRDADGTIASFKILSLPSAASGKLYLNNLLVIVGQVITPAKAKELQFEVLSTFTGNATFTYTVIDNDGLTDSSSALFTIPVVNNSSTLVCSVGVLGTNVLADRGTFSTPFIVPSATLSCVNNGAAGSFNPPQNVGKAHPETTTYTYTSASGGLGPEGTYTFLKTIGTMTAKNCIKGDWVASDHTGDGGYFMVVNGSPKVGTFGKTFFSYKTQPVCENTLYEFSAYVINVLPGTSGSATPGSEPNISFYINGQLVSTSGAIKYSDASTGYTPQWVKVGGLWYSGPNTTVDLRIDNATFVAAGNDLGLDDISMAICGPEITYPDNDLSPKFCMPGILPLSATVKSSINTYSYYQFELNKNDGNGWQSLPKGVQTGSPEVAVDGSYSYVATYGDIPVTFDMNGYQFRLKVATDPANLTGVTCNIAATKVITVAAMEYPNAGIDVNDCTGITSYQFAAAKAGETWKVAPGNPVNATIDQTGLVSGMTANGEYKFILTNSIGCEDFVSVFRYKINDLPVTNAALCSNQDTYTLPVPAVGYTWQALAGNPSVVIIDQVNGNVTGITNSGTYQFLLRSDFADCTANFTLLKAEPIVIGSNSTVDLCIGNTFDLTKAITNYDETKYTYTFTDPLGNVVPAPYKVSAAGDYHVNAQFIAKSCTSETVTIKLIIHPKPGSPIIKLNIN